MRVNVYNEEISNEAKIVWTEPISGVRYCGVRIFQLSALELHHLHNDDDRSAVTFWVGSLDDAEKFCALLNAAVHEGRLAEQAARVAVKVEK